ncbi:hypothetical protein V2G26_012014 [Clonostachys chloroleuca]
MPSLGSETDDVQYSIPEDGFIYAEDAALGQRVSTMRGTPYASVDGFAFFKQNIMDDSNIMSALKSCLHCESMGLGLYRTLGPVPGAYSFRRSNPDLPVESVVVHLLDKETEIVLWKASHRAKVPFFKGKIGLWQATSSELEGAGLQCVKKTFENGGYCIRDTRVFMEVLNGRAITFAIAKEDVVKKWEPMELDESLNQQWRKFKRQRFRSTQNTATHRGRERKNKTD